MKQIIVKALQLELETSQVQFLPTASIKVFQARGELIPSISPHREAWCNQAITTGSRPVNGGSNPFVSIMFEEIKKYNNKILTKKDKEHLDSLIKDLPKDVQVKQWNWYKHNRIALIKDGYLI